MAPFESLRKVSYSHLIATMAVFLAVSTQYTKVTDTHPASQTPHDRRAALCSITRLQPRGKSIILLLLVCVSFTIIGQPRNSVLIRRV